MKALIVRIDRRGEKGNLKKKEADSQPDFPQSLAFSGLARDQQRNLFD